MSKKMNLKGSGKLSLRRETLRPLTPTELKLVAGGAVRRPGWCASTDSTGCQYSDRCGSF